MSSKRPSVARQVHGWRAPIVAWARRKPRSHFRQQIWELADRLDWRLKHPRLPLRFSRQRSR